MKYLKLFEQFNSNESIDDMKLSGEERSKLMELGLGETRRVYFVSPITVSEDYTTMFDYLQNLDPRQVADVLSEKGMDVSHILRNLEQSEDDENALDTFFDEINQELEAAAANQIPLADSSVDLSTLEGVITGDFNESNLFQYYEGSNKANSIQAVGLTDEGEFKVKVEFERPATKEDIEEMKEFLSGQYSDGWGEGFEQRPLSEDRRRSEPSYYIHTWSSEIDWYINETY